MIDFKDQYESSVFSTSMYMYMSPGVFVLQPHTIWQLLIDKGDIWCLTTVQIYQQMFLCLLLCGLVAMYIGTDGDFCRVETTLG